MDRVATTTLSEVLRLELATYAGAGISASGPSKLYYVENQQDQVFCIVGPYEPAYKKAMLVIMAHIVNDKIVIDTDITGSPLYEALRQAGVHDDQIVIAWKPNRQ